MITSYFISFTIEDLISNRLGLDYRNVLMLQIQQVFFALFLHL